MPGVGRGEQRLAFPRLQDRPRHVGLEEGVECSLGEMHSLGRGLSWPSGCVAAAVARNNMMNKSTHEVFGCTGAEGRKIRRFARLVLHIVGSHVVQIHRERWGNRSGCKSASNCSRTARTRTDGTVQQLGVGARYLVRGMGCNARHGAKRRGLHSGISRRSQVGVL